MYWCEKCIVVALMGLVILIFCSELLGFVQPTKIKIIPEQLIWLCDSGEVEDCQVAYQDEASNEVRVLDSIALYHITNVYVDAWRANPKIFPPVLLAQQYLVAGKEFPLAYQAYHELIREIISWSIGDKKVYDEVLAMHMRAWQHNDSHRFFSTMIFLCSHAAVQGFETSAQYNQGSFTDLLQNTKCVQSN